MTLSHECYHMFYESFGTWNSIVALFCYLVKVPEGQGEVELDHISKFTIFLQKRTSLVQSSPRIPKLLFMSKHDK